MASKQKDVADCAWCRSSFRRAHRNKVCCSKSCTLDRWRAGQIRKMARAVAERMSVDVEALAAEVISEQMGWPLKP